MPYINWKYNVYEDDPERTAKEEARAALTAYVAYFLGSIVVAGILLGVLFLAVWEVPIGFKIFIVVGIIVLIVGLKLLKKNRTIRLFTSKKDKEILRNKAWLTNETVIYCHKCGEEMQGDSMFCRRCGTGLKI